MSLLMSQIGRACAGAEVTPTSPPEARTIAPTAARRRTVPLLMLLSSVASVSAAGNCGQGVTGQGVQAVVAHFIPGAVVHREAVRVVGHLEPGAAHRVLLLDRDRVGVGGVVVVAVLLVDAVDRPVEPDVPPRLAAIWIRRGLSRCGGRTDEPACGQDHRAQGGETAHGSSCHIVLLL